MSYSVIRRNFKFVKPVLLVDEGIYILLN
uniref:Uncharacterized protein n=1 Tax=Rhizophora mucronata TaxID=61149 RepID=A0A2P2PU88_RHIMU